MGPLLRSNRTLTTPPPAAVRTRRTGALRTRPSQAASSSDEGESLAPATTASLTASYGAPSSAAASSPRQSVTRVQARSVSPGWYCAASRLSTSRGFRASAESVIRRCAIRAMGSERRSLGGSCGHQATTGESASSSGTTTDWPCLASSP